MGDRYIPMIEVRRHIQVLHYKSTLLLDYTILRSILLLPTRLFFFTRNENLAPMSEHQDVAALGVRARVVDAFHQDPARFRLDFTHDLKTKELRWVLFTGPFVSRPHDWLSMTVASRQNGLAMASAWVRTHIRCPATHTAYTYICVCLYITHTLSLATRRGCIGKIIFTLEKDASAHVKSIVVNPEWRGYGLARILYHACLSTLRELNVTSLHLEAEEDTKRHGKLVGLYETWGFQPKADAKVLFLYNDTQCFRKVPMLLPFASRAFFPIQPSAATAPWFCMLTLQTADGACLVASEDGAIEAGDNASDPASRWETLLGPSGEIYLRSVHGKFLCVEESGNVLANRQLNSTWETFQVVPHRIAGDVSNGIALQDFHGSYLCIDAAAKRVVASHEPVPWDGGDIMALVCNKPNAAPLSVKILRKYQTAAFVKRQEAKYADFQHASLSIADACALVQRLNGDADAHTSWVLRFMLASAEAVREDGHPDWLQLAFFLYVQWPSGKVAMWPSD